MREPVTAPTRPIGLTADALTEDPSVINLLRPTFFAVTSDEEHHAENTDYDVQFEIREVASGDLLLGG